MPYTTFCKLGKGLEDLLEIDMMLKYFGGNASKTQGIVNVELTIGRKTLLTTFFIIDGKGTYILLLGHDWIHANCCIPSTMHQCLIQWQGDNVKVVQADTSMSVSTTDLAYQGFEECECFSGRLREGGVSNSMMNANNRFKQSALRVYFNDLFSGEYGTTKYCSYELVRQNVAALF